MVDYKKALKPVGRIYKSEADLKECQPGNPWSDDAIKLSKEIQKSIHEVANSFSDRFSNDEMEYIIFNSISQSFSRRRLSDMCDDDGD